MKIAAPATIALLLAACDPPRPPPPPPPRVQGIADIPSPVNVPPPVDSVPFEDGYKVGVAAGAEAAAATPRTRKKREAPTDDEIAVTALAAAGTDKEKGPKWQRGFISGYRDGFARIAEGKR